MATNKARKGRKVLDMGIFDMILATVVFLVNLVFIAKAPKFFAEVSMATIEVSVHRVVNRDPKVLIQVGFLALALFLIPITAIVGNSITFCGALLWAFRYGKGQKATEALAKRV